MGLLHLVLFLAYHDKKWEFYEWVLKRLCELHEFRHAMENFEMISNEKNNNEQISEKNNIYTQRHATYHYFEI